MIGNVFKEDGLLMVNGWNYISCCTFDNHVLYMWHNTNFLDLRDIGIHWFKREVKVWVA